MQKQWIYEKTLEDIKDKRIKEIYKNISYKNRITIYKSHENNMLSVHTTKDDHHHNVKTYEDKNGEYLLKDDFWFYTPYNGRRGFFEDSNNNMFILVFEQKGLAGMMPEGYANIIVLPELIYSRLKRKMID